MTLTRRDATKLVLAGPALAAVPLPAGARTPEEWAALLQQELSTHLVPGCDGTLKLQTFDMRRRGNRVQMAAVIRLDWPPGYRTRRFDALGDKESAAYSAVLNQALLSFAKAWPGCVV